MSCPLVNPGEQLQAKALVVRLSANSSGMNNPSVHQLLPQEESPAPRAAATAARRSSKRLP